LSTLTLDGLIEPRRVPPSAAGLMVSGEDVEPDQWRSGNGNEAYEGARGGRDLASTVLWRLKVPMTGSGN